MNTCVTSSIAPDTRTTTMTSQTELSQVPRDLSKLTGPDTHRPRLPTHMYTAHIQDPCQAPQNPRLDWGISVAGHLCIVHRFLKDGLERMGM